MSRWWPVGVFLLILGAVVTVAVMWPRGELPAGQNVVYDVRTRQPIAVTDNTLCPPHCTKEAEIARAQVQYPFLGPTPAMQKLQWLADEANCQASDIPAMMASCIQERIAKVRYKAKLYKAKYEALVTLERDYWGHLRPAGLYPVILHCRTPRIQDCEGP